jgi:putative protease
MFDKNKLPELLCPAGDMRALCAALEGGADAVYFGGVDFNARRNAKNFGADEMREAVKLAHAYGAKAYVTQNTLCHDRELTAYLSAAETALFAGADALIVADMGGAQEIKKRFPFAELHASTQMSGHNVAAAKMLCELGFSRMVCAREMSRDDIAAFTANSPIEAEVFVHGALCVCHSGQCLFSSMVGGRSGNRGECAQPCRLPYSGGYPLSLKDSSLATHIPTLIELGVASLKIEGRMKSAEYVRDVTAIYRRLLDERRSANKDEMEELAEIFSRGGFTDGYFTKNIGKGMLGVRSESDKKKSGELAPFEGLTKKLPVDIRVKILRGKPCVMSLGDGKRSVEYVSQTLPMEALNAPLSSDVVKKQLTKFGSTPYEVREFVLELDEGLMIPVSALNKLRRDAVELFEKRENGDMTVVDAPLSLPEKKQPNIKTAVFYSADQIPESAKDYFDVMFLPLHKYAGETDGVALPPVIFDSELPEVEAMLKKAVADGAKYALVGNLGHVELAKKYRLALCGDLRLNVFNSSSAALCEKLGFEFFIKSPELALPQARDLKGAGTLTVYGRLPLMLLEKCVGKEIGGCGKCDGGRLALKDRMGAEFPVLREWKHRSLVFNSIHTSMSDKQELLVKNGATARHFIFSDESKEECERVVNAFKKGLPIDKRARRIGSAVPTKN